jgi:hypothetical protein
VSSGRLKFNFLSYESITSGADLEENIVNLMIEVARITNPQGKGGENEEFWQSQRKKLLRNIVGLLLPVDGSVDLLRMNAILNSAPRIQPRRGRRIGAIPRRFSKRSPDRTGRWHKNSRTQVPLDRGLLAARASLNRHPDPFERFR